MASLTAQYRCFYCALPYRVVAKYETFQQDLRWPKITPVSQSDHQVHWSPVKCNIPGGFAGKCGRSGRRREERHLREGSQLFQAGLYKDKDKETLNTLTTKIVQKCDVRAVLHSCDVFS